MKLSQILQLIVDQMKVALQSERRQMIVSAEMVNELSKAIEYIKRFETP